MKQEDVYWNICYYGITFFIYVMLALFIMMKLDFRMDRSAKLVIILFVMSLGTRLLGWFAFFFTNDESSNLIGWLEILDMNSM